VALLTFPEQPSRITTPSKYLIRVYPAEIPGDMKIGKFFRSEACAYYPASIIASRVEGGQALSCRPRMRGKIPPVDTRASSVAALPHPPPPAAEPPGEAVAGAAGCNPVAGPAYEAPEAPLS